jgi:hypothetical protein
MNEFSYLYVMQNVIWIFHMQHFEIPRSLAAMKNQQTIIVALLAFV